jgi:hypothetical protein
MLSTFPENDLRRLQGLSLQLVALIRKKDFSAASELLRRNPKLPDYIKSTIHNDEKIYDEVFNKEIIVVIDVGEKTFDAGHAFIGYQTQDGSMKWRGFYPKSDGVIYAPGETEDDSIRLSNFHILKHIRISEERWEKLDETIKNYDARKVLDTYSLLRIPFTNAGNCCHFVNAILLLSGVTQGLMGVFSFQDLCDLHKSKSLSLIKTHLAWNYILDRPSLDDPEIDDASNAAINDVLAQKVNEAKEKAEHEKRNFAIDSLLKLIPHQPSPTLIFSLAGNLQNIHYNMGLVQNASHLTPELRADITARLQGSLQRIMEFRRDLNSGNNGASSSGMGL